MNSGRSRRYRLLAAAIGSFLAAGAGCVHYQAKPVNPEDTAAAFSARSLSDDRLRRYLAANLGREPSPWPLAAWDLDTLTWAAFYFQPSLEVARAQWAEARAAIRTAAANPNPTLTLTPGYDTSVGPGVSPWFPSVQLNWLWSTAHKRDHQVAAAQFRAEAARLDVFAAAWQVRSDLRRAVIATGAAERRLGLVNEEVAAARELETLMQQRFDAGAISAFDLSAARAARVRAEAAAVETRLQAPQARSEVAQAIGVPSAALDGVRLPDLLGAPAPALSAGDLAAARRASLRSRTDLLAALARYEAAQADLQLEIARQYPDLQIGPGYQYDLGENKWSLALAFDLPVLHRNQGPIAEAEARRRAAAAQFLALQARAIAEIDRAAAARDAAMAQLAQLRSARDELQTQAVRLMARFNAGESDRLALLSARSDLAAAELAVADAEAGAAEAAGQLENALQIPFANLAPVADSPPAGQTASP